MNEMVLWSIWYGVLVTLPLVMTRPLIKNAMARAIVRRRRLSPINRR